VQVEKPNRQFQQFHDFTANSQFSKNNQKKSSKGIKNPKTVTQNGLDKKPQNCLPIWSPPKEQQLQ